MQTLLIADCNEDFRLALAEAFQPYFRVLSCGNGRAALDLACREKPDFLVLDLMLPELDGLSLLETLCTLDLRPRVLVITTLLTDYVLTSARQLGIEYIIRKPCPIPAALSRLLDISSSTAFTPGARTEKLLKSLKINENHQGFSYLSDGILMLAKDPDLSITKNLYPDIARLHRKKASHVERSIRSALECGFLLGDPALWQSYFPGTKKRPSNGQFLTEIARRIREGTE